VLVLVLILVIGSSLTRVRDALHGAASPVWTPVTQQRLSHGRFENFTVYVPHATPKGFVLMLSGTDGWTPNMSAMAMRLAEQGAMVAGLDVAQLNAALQSDGGQCVYPDGDLENLSHFVQAYFHLPSYSSPILAGYSAGATLAYATLVQAPKSTFAGAVSLNFCPHYDLNKPLCEGSGIKFSANPGKGVDFLPSPQTGNAWTVLQKENEAACDVAAVRSFVAQVPGAKFIAVPATHAGTPSPGPVAADWEPAYSAVDALMAQHPGVLPAAVPSALGDLPIVTVPAQAGTTPSDTFAIILSGDGGWAGLDKEVAGALAATGIPVIGLDSLRYFWSARTPAGLAADIDRIAGYYLEQLGKQHVMLIGYSQGADVLPFAINRLSPSTRSHVALTAIIGMSEHALFEFHMSSWVADDNSGPATLPEVERITGMPVLCIYGEGEDDTLCPKLDPRKVTIVKLKGGHHFDGDYAGLARAILASAHR
jgi:type IV secretory pathway VirJ component